MTTKPKSDLAQELKQNRPFSAPGQEAYLSIQRTASDLSRSMDQLLKQSGITQPQYNVLRILQGAEPDGLARNEISERMVTATPDMSRLLDRMEKANWVTRERRADDKRQVTTRITTAGKRLLAATARPIAKLHQAQFQGMPEKEINTLLDLLNQVRRTLSQNS